MTLAPVAAVQGSARQDRQRDPASASAIVIPYERLATITDRQRFMDHLKDAHLRARRGRAQPAEDARQAPAPRAARQASHERAPARRTVRHLSRRSRPAADRLRGRRSCSNKPAATSMCRARRPAAASRPGMPAPTSMPRHRAPGHRGVRGLRLRRRTVGILRRHDQRHYPEVLNDDRRARWRWRPRRMS